MDISKSLNPVKGFEKIMNGMKKVPLLYVPLFGLPSAAFAMDAPPGFAEFSPLHKEGFL